MNIFIIQGKSGIYPGIWMSRANAEADREMVACAGVSGDVVEMVPASEVREKDELIQRLADALNAFDYDGGGTFLRTFGLVKVDGKWEEIEG